MFVLSGLHKNKYKTMSKTSVKTLHEKEVALNSWLRFLFTDSVMDRVASVCQKPREKQISPLCFLHHLFTFKVKCTPMYQILHIMNASFHYPQACIK